MSDTPIPTSAYFVCYLPLAVTIIGMITASALTDKHATRRYLRFFTPRTERPATPTEAQTPAGGPTVILQPESPTS